MAARIEPVPEQKIHIAIETTLPESRILRVGRKEAWQHATLDDVINKILLSHEKWKAVDPTAYETEEAAVVDVRRLMQGRYHAVVNESSIVVQDALNFVKISDLLSPIDPCSPNFELLIRVNQDEAPKKVISKYEVLKEQMRETVDSLPLTGLFVGNLLQEKDLDPRAVEYLSGKTVNDMLARANKMLRSRDFKSALQIYELFMKARPENADYRYLRGKALMGLNQYADGLKSLQQAQSLGHERAGVVIKTLIEFRNKHGVYPLGEQIAAL
jgi:tetratricopeptide (TPR) repeat protein